MLNVIFEETKKVLDDFQNITGMGTSLYDENMKAIYHTSQLNAKICSKMRNYPELKNKCLECDSNNVKTSTNTRKPCVSICHAGLVEVYIPICENNVIIGYIVTGQILSTENIEYAKSIALKYGEKYAKSKNEFLNLLEETEIIERKYLDSAIDMLKMCASYLYLSNIIKKKTDVLSVQLKEYIKNHLAEDLSEKKLRHVMYMSKTKLYKLSLKAFGMGCSEYILKKRIEKAKELLVTTDKSIHAISEEVGFNNTTYFTRIFKQNEGIAPSQYRKKK